MANVKKTDPILKKLIALGYSPIFNEEAIQLNERWQNWYKGYLSDFHKNTNYQGTVYAQKVEMFRLGMWKQIAELWADNMFNPETKVIFGSEDNQNWWDELSENMSFESRMNNTQEKTFALGNIGTVEYKDKYGTIFYDEVYINGFYPLELINKEVVSCAIASYHSDDTLYLTIHDRQNDGSYNVYNYFYQIKEDGEIGNLIENEDIKEEFTSDVKLFQLHTPSIVNNIDLTSPFGISVLANAEQEIKAVDHAFNALIKEIIHGKIRVYLKEGALEFDIDGDTVQVINPNQEEFYVLKGDDTNDEGEFIDVQAPNLRSPDLIDTLNTTLNLLGRKVGLGDNVFTFEEGTIYTNTAQVVSSNSKFYKTRQKHGRLMSANIISMIQAFYFLEHERTLEDTITIQMDDSIIHDKEEEMNRVMQMFNVGIVSEVYVIQTMLDMEEKEAVKFLAKQRKYKELEEEVEFED